jgi:hypothetical protein
MKKVKKGQIWCHKTFEIIIIIIKEDPKGAPYGIFFGNGEIERVITYNNLKKEGFRLLKSKKQRFCKPLIFHNKK